MPVKSLTVKRVFIKDIDPPRVSTFEGKEIITKNNVSFEDTDGEWYSLGGCDFSKRGYIYTKNGDITEGAELDVVYTEREYNGKVYKDTKKTKIEITKKGVARPSKVESGGTAGTTQATYSGGPNPAAVGQCINIAIDLKLASSYEELLDPKVVAEAVAKYNEAKDVYTAAMANKPVVKVEVKEVVIDEDDIPF